MTDDERCTATTRRGTRCRNPATYAEHRCCGVHLPDGAMPPGSPLTPEEMVGYDERVASIRRVARERQREEQMARDRMLGPAEFISDAIELRNRMDDVVGRYARKWLRRSLRLHEAERVVVDQEITAMHQAVARFSALRDVRGDWDEELRRLTKGETP